MGCSLFNKKGILNDILGVIGHYGSQITSDVADIYGKAELVAISPASTVPRKGYRLKFHDYVFRTAPTDTIAAGDLVNYLKSRRNVLWKVAIVVDNDEYAQSLSGEFQRKFPGRIVRTCNFPEQHFRLETCITQAITIDPQTNVLLLALSNETLNFQGVSTNIFSLRSNMKILLGGDTLYDQVTKSADINTIGNEKLVLAVPWHKTKKDEPNSQIVQSSRKFEESFDRLWGTWNVNWRTAMTYDATKVMVEALKQTGASPTRKHLYRVLSSQGFSTQGATGIVKFNSDHDREPTGIGVLVKVENSAPKSNNPPDFVILKRPDRSQS